MNVAKSQKDPDAIARNKETYAVVGELVLISTALDFLLNQVLIAVCDLGESALIEPVIATLDGNRKIEILRSQSKHMTNVDFRKPLRTFCDEVEAVFKQRNIACHTPPVLHDGNWTFVPVAAKKMLDNLDLATKKIRPVTVDQFRAAIRKGELAFVKGTQVTDNFKRIHSERKHQNCPKSQK